MSLFSVSTGSGVIGEASIFNSMKSFEAIESDFHSFHASTRGHPVHALRERGFVLPKLNTRTTRACASGASVETAGLVIVRQRPSTANGTIFATLEDEFGFLDLILHRDTYKAFHEVFDAHSFLQVRGKLQKDGNSISLLVKRISPVWQNETLTPESHNYY